VSTCKLKLLVTAGDREAYQIEVITREASAMTLSIVADAVTTPDTVSFSAADGIEVIVGRTEVVVFVGIGRMDREEPI